MQVKTTVSPKTASILERKAKIISLAQTALELASDTKKQARSSIDLAMECGKLLLQEKMRIKKHGRKMKWLDYFESSFRPHLPYSTATLWMRMASHKGSQPSQNMLRTGMLALEIFPSKVHPSQIGAPEAPKFVSFTSPASIINRFVHWRAKFGEKVLSNSLTEDHINLLKTQFAPMIEFITQLQSGTLPEAKKPAERTA